MMRLKLTDWISKSEIIALRAENSEKPSFREIHRFGQQQREDDHGNKYSGFTDQYGHQKHPVDSAVYKQSV